MDAFSIPAAELLPALRNTPLLEVLDVELDRINVAFPPSVSLMRLQKMGLSGSVRSCASVFERLKIPADTKIQILTPPRDHIFPTTVDSTLQAISLWVERCAKMAAERTPIRQIRIAVGFSQCSLWGWRTSSMPLPGDLGVNYSIAPSAPDVRLELTRYEPEARVSTLLNAVCFNALETVILFSVAWTGAVLPAFVHLVTLPTLRFFVAESTLLPLALHLIAKTTARTVVLGDVSFFESEDDALPTAAHEMLYGIQLGYVGLAEELVNICTHRQTEGRAFDRLILHRVKNFRERDISALRDPIRNTAQTTVWQFAKDEGHEGLIPDQPSEDDMLLDFFSID